MKVFAMVAAGVVAGFSLGFYAAVKLEERYILKPLNAYVDLCVKECEELNKFKIVDEEGEKE